MGLAVMFCSVLFASHRIWSHFKREYISLSLYYEMALKCVRRVPLFHYTYHKTVLTSFVTCFYVISKLVNDVCPVSSNFVFEKLEKYQPYSTKHR